MTINYLTIYCEVNNFILFIGQITDDIDINIWKKFNPKFMKVIFHLASIQYHKIFNTIYLKIYNTRNIHELYLFHPPPLFIGVFGLLFLN